MDFKTYDLGPDDLDRRLDKVIRKFLPDHSLSEIYKLIRKGLIKVNTKKTKENYHFLQGDTLQIADFLINSSKENEGNNNKKSGKVDLQVVFENQDILIINKPYDIKVHGDDRSLDRMVKDYYLEKHGKSSLSFLPGPLHRLDRKTTGLLAFSMSLNGARWFTENIEKHTIRKTYMGIVEGNLEKSEKWVDFIEKNDESEGFHTVTASKEENQGKKAVTTITPVEKRYISGKETTICTFEIETGRTHQIRSQCALHGFPLLGDSAYGTSFSGDSSLPKRDFYLHAWKLEFPKGNPLNLPEILVCEPEFV